MATNFYNTAWDHSSDATFRAWGSALSAAIQAAGAGATTHPGKLVQTTDTGQINWSTVTRPGTNTAGGYEIYKTTDSNSGGSPLYIKIEYGTGGGAAFPAIWITIGTGSNGSGTLTGSTGTRTLVTRNTSMTSTSTLYPTYVHSSEDCPLNVYLKLGAGSGGTGFAYFGVGRPCNLDATIRSDAIVLVDATGSACNCEVVRVSDGVKFGGSSNSGFGMVPLGITASAVGGNFQVFQCVCAYPQIYGLNWIGIVLSAELTLNTSDTATMYGATSHTYVSAGATLTGFSVQGTVGHVPFMLYEA